MTSTALNTAREVLTILEEQEKFTSQPAACGLGIFPTFEGGVSLEKVSPREVWNLEVTANGGIIVYHLIGHTADYLLGTDENPATLEDFLNYNSEKLQSTQ